MKLNYYLLNSTHLSVFRTWRHYLRKWCVSAKPPFLPPRSRDTHGANLSETSPTIGYPYSPFRRHPQACPNTTPPPRSRPLGMAGHPSRSPNPFTPRGLPPTEGWLNHSGDRHNPLVMSSPPRDASPPPADARYPLGLPLPIRTATNPAGDIPTPLQTPSMTMTLGTPHNLRRYPHFPRDDPLPSGRFTIQDTSNPCDVPKPRATHPPPRDDPLSSRLYPHDTPTPLQMPPLTSSLQPSSLSRDTLLTRLT
jgi:hypothetical protein